MSIWGTAPEPGVSPGDDPGRRLPGEYDDRGADDGWAKEEPCPVCGVVGRHPERSDCPNA